MKMNREELLYTLAISYTKGLGDVNTKKIIDFVGSAKKAWELKKTDLLQIKGLGKKTLENFGAEANLDLAKKELVFGEKYQINAAHYNEERYPNRLKHCIDGPSVLFWKGNFHFDENPSIAIVGTRKMTNYGKNFIQSLVSNLKNYPIKIYSGLALGSDITAHRAALENKMQTIAVLAHGLDKVYPKSNQKEANKMLENGGLVSEFSTFHKPEPINFLKRNRIVAGLSDLIVLVESDYKGGAMSTVKFANNYNREVMALPGRLSDRYSNGCNHLIATHQALLIRNAEDLLYHLNLKPKKKLQQKKLFVDLKPEEKKVYDFLLENGKQQLDELCLNLEFSSYEILPILLNLELLNLVNPLPGKYFELIN